MRILALVTDAYGGYGGIAKYNRDLLAALCTHPRVTEVTALPRSIPFPVADLPNKLNYVADAANGKFSYFHALTRELVGRDPQPQLVIAGHINLGPLAYLVAQRCHSQLALLIYGIDAWRPASSFLRNFAARHMDRVVSISELTRDRFSGWSGIRSDKVTIVPCSIDLHQWSPGPKDASLLRRYGLTESRVLLTVGRLDSRERYKGFDLVIEVLPELARSIPNIAYLIVGNGDDRERLQQKAESLGVSDRVVFAGYVPEEEKQAHYRIADVFVMPSNGEGFGIVFLEAMACGVPVIASRTDGGREALRDGKLGRLVDPANRQEVAAAMLQALQTEDRGVPDGMDYFGFSAFEKRIHDLVDGMLAHSTATNR